jgi:regulatory protein
MNNKMARQYHTKEQALQKLQRYCAYQERCHREVRSKLLELGVRGMALEEVIVSLIDEGYLNEQRFAEAYARGKFRIKGWGRVKIAISLRQKGVSDYCVNKGLEQIDEDDYLVTLQSMAQKKFASLGGNCDLPTRLKLEKYIVGKGFERNLVIICLQNLFGN